MNQNSSTSSEEMIPVMMSISQIGQSWMHIGYRIRGNTALLIGHEKGNRILPFSTRLQLYKNIVSDLEILAAHRVEFDEYLPKILKNIEKNMQRRKNERKGTQVAYTVEFLEFILNAKRSKSDIEYILLFLERYISLRRETVIRILFAPKIPSLLGVSD